MTLLHYDLPGKGKVLEQEFEDHFLELSKEAEHLAETILQDGAHWRLATEDEIKAFAGKLKPKTKGAK